MCNLDLNNLDNRKIEKIGMKKVAFNKVQKKG
jgi:hypothetical protein